MENVPKDIINELALNLSLKDIKSFCLTSKKFNNIVCDSELFWKKKLFKDHPNINIQNVRKFKKLYFYLNENTEKEMIFPEFYSNKNVYIRSSLFLNILNKLDIGDNKKEYVTEIVGNFGEIYKIIIKSNFPSNFLLQRIKEGKNEVSSILLNNKNDIFILNLSSSH